MNGAGEMLVFSAADFEDFLEPRPDLPPSHGSANCTGVVRLLAENRWPFRLHATYDESISRFLDVFEAVNRDVPFDGLRWFFDHAETVTDRNLERIKALGGGIAVQHRMAFQGEYFIDRYGAKAAEHTPPIAEMLRDGHPGRRRAPTPRGWRATTRGSACTGWSRARRSAALSLYPEANRLDREGGAAAVHPGGRLVLGRGGRERGIAQGGPVGRPRRAVRRTTSPCPRSEIKGIESVLTVVGGKVVYAAGPFAALAPPPLPVSPDWSPVGVYGGYHRVAAAPRSGARPPAAARPHDGRPPSSLGGCRDGEQAVMGRELRVLGVLTDRCLDLVERSDHDDSVDGM